MRALLPLLLTGCLDEPLPELPPFPDEPVPYLSSDADGESTACSAPRQVKVACGVDGDTFDLGDCGGDAERVRLLGIDAPETEKPGTPAECGADLAAAELNRILANRVVTLRFDRDCEGVFGRTLAYVEMEADDARRALGADDVEEIQDLQGTEEGTPILLNTWLLWTGLARRFDEAWVEPLREESVLVAAERLARSQSRGVWGACE